MSASKPILYCFLSLLLTFIACKANKTLVEQSTQKVEEKVDTIDTSKIMVLLKTGIKANALEEEFKVYELQSKGLISRTENRCMFIYNQSLVDGNSLLEMIKKSNSVVEARFPKIVHQPKATN